MVKGILTILCCVLLMYCNKEDFKIKFPKGETIHRIDTVNIYLRDTLYRDTVQVKMMVNNIFYVVVPVLEKGRGFGKNIPSRNKADTVFWIRYPYQKDYSIIKREMLRAKFKNLNI